MTKILEDYIKKIKKLNNYLILQEKPTYLILGTTITIKEHKEVHLTFSTYTSNVQKHLNIFFIVSLENLVTKEVWEKDYNDFSKMKEKNIPITTLPNFNVPMSKVSDEIEYFLDIYINKI